MKMLIDVTRALAVALACSMAHAQTNPDLLIDGFRTTFKDDAGASSRVAEIERSVAIVLVPGILGSKLTSPSLGVIWGSGLPNLDAIRLPDSLIDERAESDVEAVLLESYFGDQYGEAFARIQSTTQRLKIKAIACGYDWRRDIRSGARDLERCLQKALGDKRHTLVFVSHSMGGLVTSVWNQQHEAGQYGKPHLVGGLALLGSPLGGSCEILRMVNTGYVKPTESDLAANRYEYVYEKLESWAKAAANALTGFFTDDIRSVVLTWPGAFGLSPKAAHIDTDRYCVLLRASAGDSDPRVVSFFDASFWTAPIASELLRNAVPGASFDQVLRKAQEFRSGFDFKQPRAPLYAFYSTFWRTPESAISRPGSHLSLSGDWRELEGDGRVPLIASRPDYQWLADFRNVYSVHGGLPKDAVFQGLFLDNRLQKLVSAMTAYRLITEVAGTQEARAQYARAGAALPIPTDFVASIEAPDTQRPGPRSPLTADVVAAVEAFAQAVCEAGTRCQSLQFTRAAIANAPSAVPNFKDRQALSRFGGVTASLASSPLDRAQAQAQIGLAHARLGNASSSGGALASASRDLASNLLTADLSTAGRRQLEDLQLTVNRNLARSLRESGQCSAAKAILVALSAQTAKYGGDLTARCFDRESGLYKDLASY